MWGEKECASKDTIKKMKRDLGMVVHVYNPNTRETKSRGLTSSRPAWAT
jgi:hypothetical protein